jgi:hypothetical protein
VDDIQAAGFNAEAGKPFEVDFYWDGSDLYIRAFDVGETAPAFSSVATDGAIGTTFEIGTLNSGSWADGNYLSVELSTSKEDFGW